MIPALRANRHMCIAPTLALLCSFGPPPCHLVDDLDLKRGAIASAGDHDQDGVPDLFVADRLRGLVWVLSGRSGTLIRTLALPSDDGRINALGTAGDLDDDGSLELVVGGGGGGIGGIGACERGGIVVYASSDGAVLWTLEPVRRSERFGESVAGGRDVTGDGVADLIVGASPCRSDGRGRAYLYSGATRELVRVFEGGRSNVVHWDPASKVPTAGVQIAGDAGGVRMGRSVAMLPDLNGDGIAELILGVPIFLAEAAGDERQFGGYAEVLSGGSFEQVYRFVPGEIDQYEFGWSVGSAGDFDGDRIADVFVAAIHTSVYVYSGRTGQLLAASHYGQAMLRAAGSSVAVLGDVNRDGFDDLAIGANESALLGADNGFVEVRLVFREAGRLGARRTFRWEPSREDVEGMSGPLGVDVCGPGDVTGDGVPDLALFLPRLGIVRVFSGASFEVVYEVALRDL